MRPEFQPCPKCERLLAPMPSGALPPHRVPASTRERGQGAQMSTPLTGRDQLWCGGR